MEPIASVLLSVLLWFISMAPGDTNVCTGPNWDRMAQFYASLETGHVTASTALKRIVGFTSKHHFYQANLQLGRIPKTEHILYWMADPHKRRRTRKRLLKVEQIHQLARDITYGNRGRLKGKTLEEITSSGNCTTLIMAAIIYWQAREK